ncbi:MAG: PBP1A family penicillin-binding protein [Deltaproteobacteria bacterium]|nr:PBP1A family penicillin-binding protein [Deltaproteobacteria bacterium]
MNSNRDAVIKKIILGVAGLLLVPVFLSAAPAEEKTMDYPHFPSGYVSIKVFDNQGRFAGRILPEKRYGATIDQIPVFLQNALVAIEDARFYEHQGIDLRGITRALVKDVAKGKMAEGGSTITQQLIKNKLLTAEKTLGRKLKEGLLALEYERKYTKKQILEMYFNEVYFGNGAWGIVQAARLYFDKYPRELTQAECALLAGVPKAPTRYNPLGNPASIRDRKNLILKRMTELKMITAAQEKKLRAQRISVIQPAEAPYYLGHIRNKLVERYGEGVIEQGGLEVTAAMDLSLQRTAERILSDGIRRISPELQGALLCLDPQTGDVLAAVGGVDYKQSQYNRAFFAKRQPGSAIKPLIYAAALEKGFSPGSLWNDDPVAYRWGDRESWMPQNYGRERHGEITLRQALAYSDNVITVKLLDAIGVPYFLHYAAGLGLTLRSPGDLSLALGTDDVTPSDLVSAYIPLANGGSRAEPRTIVRIYERHRDTWVENPAVVTPVLSPAVGYVTTQMLKDVLTYGTAKSLAGFSRNHPAAGKTGTTDDYRDAWFIGYTPRLITAVWAGYDKPRSLGRGFTGGAVCAPIWGRFMTAALAGKPAVDFAKPEGVVSVSIDPATGALATPGCPLQQEEFYLAGTEPVAICPKHGGVVLTPAPPVPALAPEPPPSRPDGAPSADLPGGPKEQ